MAVQEPPSRRTLIIIGALTAAAGLYFMLAALGVVPPPGKAHAPMWVAFFAGLVFLLAGIAVLIPAATGNSGTGNGELPPSAPHWLRLLQYLLGLSIFLSFALIASWIAFGPGPRTFSASGPFFSTKNAGEFVGRTAFGIGAVIIWLCTVGFAVSGARKLLGQSKR
jgi:hypothetical protein